MTWFRVGGAGIPASLKNAMNAVFNKKFGTSGQNYPPNGWPDDVNLMGPLPEGTVSGSIANFSDGADDVPTDSVKITIPASLSGVSSVTETQTGRNLIKPDKYQTASNNLALGQTDGTSFGTFLKAGTYTISYAITSGSCYIYRREQNDTSNTNLGRGTSKTFTITADGDYRFWLYGDDAVYANVSDVQLEIGSTAHAYEPYQTPTQYTASLGRTIYGGEVDIVNGEGTDENGNDFTFTGQEVPTRLGYNAFWSDSGDTEVTYRRDIDLALQAVSSSRGLMMASRPVTQLIGEESDPDQVNELNEEAENTEEQEGDNDAR